MTAPATTDATAGRDAVTPWQMPPAAWKAVALRVWKETGKDNVGLIAAGVAFYGFLALVPLLGAFVLTYGLVVEPATVIEHVNTMMGVLPRQAALLIGEQLLNVVQTSGDKKGLGLLIALGIALFGARNAAGAIITALNIAYEEEERRSFVRLNLLTIGMTGAAVIVAIIAVTAIAALGHLDVLFPAAPDAVLVLGTGATYLLLGLAGAAGAATLYRFGPSRDSARWAWLTPGSVLSSLLWLILTLGFGFYVANFGNYDATYGSLGGVIVLLTWLYLSSYILLFGGELNAELEHQTARDTTRGPDRQMGQRGAWVADHVAGDDAPPSSGAPAAPAAPAAPIAERVDYAPSPLADYTTGRATARAGRVLGLASLPMLPAVVATAGLSLLRRRGGAAKGAALMAAASGLAWWSRERRER